MRFYGMDYEALLGLPIITFWELSKNVDRIRAEEDIRLTVLTSQAFAGDPENYIKKLESEQGMVVEIESKFDRAGYERLKALVAMRNR
jgi:hypothetical protein